MAPDLFDTLITVLQIVFIGFLIWGGLFALGVSSGNDATPSWLLRTGEHRPRRRRAPNDSQHA